MGSEGAGAVAGSVTATIAVLGPHVTSDWSVAAGPLEWSCHDTGAHVGHVLVKYATQLAGSVADRYLPFDVVVRTDAGPGDVLDVIAASGRLLAATVAAADPSARAWHHGPTDPEGFAAMGVGELLVHAHDIAIGLGVAWRPPEELAAFVVRRLVPDAPVGDAADVLLWATGRAELAGASRPTDWVWAPARAGYSQRRTRAR